MFMPNPALYPEPFLTGPMAAGLAGVALKQRWMAGRNYAKYVSEGANPVAMIKVWPALPPCLVLILLNCRTAACSTARY